MKAQPDISIVLAVYNGENFLKEQIDSILRQKDVLIKEFIIVNDCSLDGSMDILVAYKNQHGFIKLLDNPTNIGPIGSFINGAKQATAMYTAFADQDDIWLDNKLSLSLQLMQEIDNENKPAVVFTDLQLISENGEVTTSSFWESYNIKPAANDFFTVLFGNIITGCTMLINRPMLDEFVNMPLTVQMHDHWIALIGFSIGKVNYSPAKTILYRIHGNSVTNKNSVTLRQTITNFFEAWFNKDSVFLKDYIRQGKLFKSHYGARLDKHLSTKLDYFIQLENSSGLVKKLKSKFRFAISKRI
jgi:glycosyltransferase involved in cell wall biosynthesis